MWNITTPVITIACGRKNAINLHHSGKHNDALKDDKQDSKGRVEHIMLA